MKLAGRCFPAFFCHFLINGVSLASLKIIGTYSLCDFERLSYSSLDFHVPIWLSSFTKAIKNELSILIELFHVSKSFSSHIDAIKNESPILIELSHGPVWLSSFTKVIKYQVCVVL